MLDALVCFFMAALMLFVLSGTVSSTLRASARAFDAGIGIIDDRNSNAVRLFEGKAVHGE
jgi:hypothetical protein